MADEPTSAADPATVQAGDPDQQPPADQRPAAPVALGFGANLERAAELVEAWFDQHCRKSPIGRDTPAWNHLLGKLEALKVMIAQEL